MFLPDWLILRILHQPFEIERPKGHWSEVMVHLYYAVDDSSRCIHVFKSFIGAFTSRQDKNAKIRHKTVARWFLLIGSDRASKMHDNGWGGEF